MAPILRGSDFKDMPWKNGQGRTLQLAIHPAGADLSNFDWRLSMATVEQSGPFSPFPGCDRTMTLVDGAGFTIETGGETLALDQPLATVRFRGDDPATCTLRAGPARDFNVITRRARFTATLEALRIPGTHRHFALGRTVIVTCLAGRVEVAGQVLEGLSLLRVDGEPGVLQLQGDAVVVLVNLKES